MSATGLIIGGWILVAGTLDGGITVIPTQYPTRGDCIEAGRNAMQGMPVSVEWTCLKAGEGKQD